MLVELIKLASENTLAAVVALIGSVTLFTTLGLFSVKESIAGIEKEQEQSTITDQRVYEMSKDVSWIKSHLESKENQNEESHYKN